MIDIVAVLKQLIIAMDFCCYIVGIIHTGLQINMLIILFSLLYAWFEIDIQNPQELLVGSTFFIHPGGFTVWTVRVSFTLSKSCDL